jgi:TP53 regulating kinase-like protein
LKKVRVLGLPAVEKLRVEKRYRNATLDMRIRRERTRREARLLARAKGAGVRCPIVYCVSDFAITMEFLPGKMLYHELLSRKAKKGELENAAAILVALHSKGIVHGDFTPANLMNLGGGMAVIDFGLGSISPDSEDQGTDVVTMKKALDAFSEAGRNRTAKMNKALGAQGEAFVQAYEKAGGKRSVLRMARQIESRARYMERG